MGDDIEPEPDDDVGGTDDDKRPAASKKKKKKKKKAADAAAGADNEESAAGTDGVPEPPPPPPPALPPTVSEGEGGGTTEVCASTDEPAAGKKKKKKPPAAARKPTLGRQRMRTALPERGRGSAHSGGAVNELMLRRCGLGDKKLRTLLAALRTCGAKCTLLSLDLSHNVISDAGAVAVRCAGGERGAGEEATTLAPALTQLSLVGNPLGKKAIETCAPRARHPPRLLSRHQLTFTTPQSLIPVPPPPPYRAPS